MVKMNASDDGGFTRPLTEAEKAELSRLNRYVFHALKERKEWLDLKTIECARFKAGDEIFDMSTGRCLGFVASAHRYHEKDSRYDDSLSIFYRLADGDNTSRMMLVGVGTREEAAQRIAQRAKQRIWELEHNR